MQQQPTPERTPTIVTAHLGLELFRALARNKPNENIFVSPDSIATALAIVLAGARDETRAEMKQVLGLPPDMADATLHEGLQLLHRRLAAGGGVGTDEQRASIAALRARLDAANRHASEAERARDWRAARAARSEAEAIAGELNAILPTIDRYELRSANALWVDRAFPLLPDYATIVDRWYGAGAAQNLDFAHDTVGAVRTINAWVAAHTNDRIRDLLTPASVPASTPMVVTNTIWFRGEWQDPFEQRHTEEQPFHLAGGGDAKVRLMRDRWREDVPYAAFDGNGNWFDTPRTVPAEGGAKPATYPDDHGLQVIELPYKGGDLAMVVMVPRSRDGLPHLERMLTAERLHAWLAKLAPRQVDTALPRFRLEATYDLSTPLRAAGMQRAFRSPEQPGGAQFGGITNATGPLQQVYIGAVHHKTFVEVAEKGTEAAAATAVGMDFAAASSVRAVLFHPVFRADRPFAFAIRDTKSNTILFIGRYVDPRS